MIDVIRKRCQCQKSQPSYNLQGETKPVCCAACKTSAMVIVTSRKCRGIRQIGCPFGHAGNPKYKNYCTECFRREFPNDPLTFGMRIKTKEVAVRDFINSHFAGFQHDITLSTNHCDCTVRRRIDHRKIIGNTLLAIETDENQHKSYDVMDEDTRYDDLYMAFSGKWIYIRFNPDMYITKDGKTKNPSLATRLAVLKDEIQQQMNRRERGENSELVERIYLYYDGYE